MNRQTSQARMAALMVLATYHASGPSTAESATWPVATQYFGDLWGRRHRRQQRFVCRRLSAHRSATRRSRWARRARSFWRTTCSVLERDLCTIDEAIVDGDTIAISWQASGTNDGAYGYLPATHKAVTGRA